MEGKTEIFETAANICDICGRPIARRVRIIAEDEPHSHALA